MAGGELVGSSITGISGRVTLTETVGCDLRNSKLVVLNHLKRDLTPKTDKLYGVVMF